VAGAASFLPSRDATAAGPSPRRAGDHPRHRRGAPGERPRGAFDPRRERMSATQTTVGVVADLTVDVTRDDHHGLEAGVRRRLRRVDAVEAVEAVDVVGLQPRLNDLRADVEAELLVAAARDGDAGVASGEDADVPAPDAGDVEAAIEAGFGVAVDGLVVRPPP